RFEIQDSGFRIQDLGFRKQACPSVAKRRRETRNKKMKHIQANIKHLRSLKELSQERFADELGWSRSIVGSYEEGRSEPPIDRLIDLSNYFKIPIDILVRNDLRKAKDTSFIDIGSKRVLFPITVNEDNEDLIEIVPAKA